MDYQYSYLIGTLVLIIIWLILFFLRKDVRKEMLILSLVAGFAGLIVDPVYSSDWWRPLTLTNTMPGIESFIFGFGVVGIGAVIYEEAFNKKLKTKKQFNIINYLFIAILTLILFFGCFFILKINSFYSSIPAFLIPLAVIFVKRRDLILDSLYSGILLTMLSIIFYAVPELITPGWITASWNFGIISKISILKIPLEDLIWFFLVGLYAGPLYEYLRGGKLVKK